MLYFHVPGFPPTILTLQNFGCVLILNWTLVWLSVCVCLCLTPCDGQEICHVFCLSLFDNWERILSKILTMTVTGSGC